MKQSRLWTVECGRSHATKITFTESEAISSMFAWKTIAMAEATIEYAARRGVRPGGMDGYGLAWVSCNTTKFMHSPAGDCTNIERTLPRLSDTMQHLSNAQRQAQYTHPLQTHTQHTTQHPHAVSHTAKGQFLLPR